VEEVIIPNTVPKTIVFKIFDRMALPDFLLRSEVLEFLEFVTNPKGAH
tara:strand:- start:1386 stop:1529 length:144 start_codon:yes stop_codon:yes gene_type:complete